MKVPITSNTFKNKLKSIIVNQLATAMEGSFGTHKTAFGLQKKMVYNPFKIPLIGT